MSLVNPEYPNASRSLAIGRTTRRRRSRQMPELANGRCIACGKLGTVPFMDENSRPLATVYWPQSEQEAKAMKSLPLAFQFCVHCSHISNSKFRYDEVPYRKRPNLMFNQGSRWIEHIRSVNESLLAAVSEQPVVVEIGCGDGHLLRELQRRRSKGTYIGFDPNLETGVVDGIEFRGELFIAADHMPDLKPELLVCRHVMEHLEQPLEFLETIASSVLLNGPEVTMFVEVPCVDQAIESGRVADFYYEHNSHFTSSSFEAMLTRSGAEILDLSKRFSGEVICGLIRFGKRSGCHHAAERATYFRRAAESGRRSICEQLRCLAESNDRVVVWGGTGKASSFMNYYGVDDLRFPEVIDSDAKKVGTFVPGTGQSIHGTDSVAGQRIDVIIIPMQWRARDILDEANQLGIFCGRVLIEHEGKLIDFLTQDHPY